MDPALAIECAYKQTNQKALRAASQRGDSEVVAFYNDATILVTGGSGFLGKQLVEKLFRSCNVKTLYVLIRGKKEKTPQMRLKEILLDPVYDSLCKQKPNFVNKIIALDGDISKPNLGLAEADLKRITKEVNIIFHMGATVNFNADMISSTLTNVRGTREVLRVARACEQLRSMVHVSTAYSHATKSRIKKVVNEEFYDVPVPPMNLIKLAENNQSETLDELFKTFGSDWPNTYTFTKAAGEELVRSLGSDLPICIVRPAIVVAAYREPAPGWVDCRNVYGPSGIILGVTIGVLHTLLANLNARIDFVPVDVVCNATIAAAYETARTHSARLNTNIYTVSDVRNNNTIRSLTAALNVGARKSISPRTVWYCFTIITNFEIVFHVLNWFLHYIPATVIDGFLVATAQKPRILKTYRNMTSLSTVLAYFIRNAWWLRDNNTLALYSSLSPTDKELFNFDMSAVNFTDLIEIWSLGVRRYIVKDELRGTEYGVKKQFYLKILHYVVLTLYLYLIFRLFSSLYASL